MYEGVGWGVGGIGKLFCSESSNTNRNLVFVGTRERNVNGFSKKLFQIGIAF